MTTLVKDKEEVQVPHAVDIAGWIAVGYKVKGQEEAKKPRELLIEKAIELGLEFAENISNKDLTALIAKATNE